MGDAFLSTSARLEHSCLMELSSWDRQLDARRDLFVHLFATKVGGCCEQRDFLEWGSEE